MLDLFPRSHPNCESGSRRDFLLQVGSLGGFGLTLDTLLRARAASGNTVAAAADTNCILIWTHGGFLMLYKRLEKGRFRWPPLEADRGTVTPAELAALLEGIDLSNARRLRRWNPRKTPVQTDRKG